MASGTFFNPKALLLITPLISSSCSLWFAHDQDLFYGTFTKQPTVPLPHANAILPSYHTAIFAPAVTRVVGLIAITTWTSIANIFLFKPLLKSRGALAWYAWGAVMAAGHLAFIPGVAWKLKAIMDDVTEEQGTDSVGMMGRWVVVNLTRAWTTDLAAWVCSVVAVMKMVAV